MQDILTFGPFTLDPSRRTLARGGEAVELGQRGCALLVALLAAAGDPVTKSTLMDKAWPGTVVEEGNLTVQIAQLRKALGTDAAGRDWIVTVPRVGYRLITLQSSVGETPDNPKPALAVLPFVNLSGDAAQDYFADGVVEDIITALSRFRSFAVIARNSSFTYKGRAIDPRHVATELGVRFVLEGGVRRSGDMLRINAQLVDCQTGSPIWAQTFDGTLQDVFGFQDQITATVASVVEPQIQIAELEHARQDRSGKGTTYDIYLLARSRLWTESDLRNTETYDALTQLLLREPDNAQLLALAAMALTQRAILGLSAVGPDDRQECVDLVRRALQNAAGDATVMADCAMALIHVAREYDWGMATIQAAVEANPNSTTVVIRASIAHIHCGNLDDALKFFHRALRLSPRDPAAYLQLTGIAHVQMILGNYTEALIWASRSLALNPNFACTYWMLIAGHAQLGQMNEAGRLLKILHTLSPDVTIARIRAGQPAQDPARMASILEGLRLAGLPE